YFRLNVIPIVVPPLRERREDIPMLIQHFVDRAVEEQRLPRRSFEPDAVEALCGMDWHGNVRELRNTIERLLILAAGSRINAAAVQRLTGAPPSLGTLPAELLAAPTFAAFKE